MGVKEKYYHGGPRGLREILPPDKTGASSCSSYGAENVCRRDHVYLTKNFDEALLFASMHPCGNGVVYEVEPQGGIFWDEDYLGETGECISCPSARVVRKFRISKKKLNNIRKAILDDARNRGEIPL